MTERPILFNGPMVRAILDGRKTQTRRVVTVRGEQPPAWATFASEGHSLMQDGKARPVGSFYWSEEHQAGKPLTTLRRWPVLPEKHPMAGDWYWTPSPYGKIGDRLWVRETHLNWWKLDEANPDGPRVFSHVAAYAADGYELEPGEKWIPSIHMLRAASRITLEITGVRVERLQSISEADAIAEGIDKAAADLWSTYGQSDVSGTYSPRLSFQCQWDSLNSARELGWDANPWVWVIEFKRIG